ncbi:maleylpyruvate isomerase family mycothiol-dependent enzyme [Nostocoides australiense]
MEILDALAAEEDQLAALLAGQTQEQWGADSLCAGWSVADVVLHLAQCEEAVIATIRGTPVDWGGLGDTVGAAMESAVSAERSDSGATIFERWERARGQALTVLRAADPARRVAWVTNTLRPATLATTRLAEHWAHALDIAKPLGLPYPDTQRLRHILWLAHATLPYAYAAAGSTAPSVRIEAVAPNGPAWVLGPDDADVMLSGPAGDLARIAARRLDPGDSAVRTSGAAAAEVLVRIRTYAV